MKSQWRRRRLLGMTPQPNTNNSKNNPIGKRLAVVTASTLALSGAVSGAIQITDEQSSQTTVVGIEHITITCFALTAL